MKLFFAAVFLLVDLLLLLFFFLAKKSGGKTSSRLGDAIVAASIAVLSHVFIVATGSPLIASLGYAFFFASVNWILLLMLRFCFAYTAFRQGDKGIVVFLESLLMLVTAMDSIIFLVNPTSGLAFVCQAVDWNGVGFH